MIEEQETFKQANEALRTVIEQIGNEQWNMKIPDNFQAIIPNARILTLRDVINYHTYDDAWIPDMMAGHTMEEAGKNKFDRDLLGDNPKANFTYYSEKAIKAVQKLDDPERTVHFSYGDYPAREALWHVTTFRSFRTHDLAKVIGVDSNLPEELVQGLWDIVKPHAEEWRAIGIFGPKVEVPENASLQDHLLGLTGRATLLKNQYG